MLVQFYKQGPTPALVQANQAAAAQNGVPYVPQIGVDGAEATYLANETAIIQALADGPANFSDRWSATNDLAGLTAYQRSVQQVADFIDSTNRVIASYAPIGDGNGIRSQLEQAQQYVSPAAALGAGSSQPTGKRSDLEQQLNPDVGDVSNRTEFASGGDILLQGVGKGTIGLFEFISGSIVTSAHGELSPALGNANKVSFVEANEAKTPDVPGWQDDITGSLVNGGGVLADRTDGVAGVTALLSWGEPLASSPSLEAPPTTVPKWTSEESPSHLDRRSTLSRPKLTVPLPKWRTLH